jgi:formate dehydrogenase major subunit
MLRKRSQSLRRDHLRTEAEGLSRRAFLRRSGLASLGVASAATFGSGMLRPAEAQTEPATRPGVELRKTICPFCAVGCSIWAEVENGVWIGQEPVFESPVNMGTHCAKGAATREMAIGERRLKYPTKLVNGRWTRLSWDEAIDEIGDRLLQIRQESGPDSVYWCGSAKFSNEQAYLMRKFVSFWGTNNTDNQARICHSTTVSGVAEMYGYGAMTNSFNDIHNSKSIFLLGGNPAEAHPVSMLHLLHAKEKGAKFIVVDPRYTRTAAHSTEFVRIRAGTDIAFLWGVLWHVLQNGWEDRDYIEARVFGFEELKEVVAQYPPDVVANITGVPEEQIERVARTLAENRPSTLIWCMGLTQSHVGTSKTRAAAAFQLAMGNIGKVGGGANIFRGHDNIQGSTDIGPMSHTLPAYYGLDEDAWRHWARVWDVDYDWLVGRFASKELMETKGITISRWFDGVLEDPANLEQDSPIRAMIFWGHACNSQTRNQDLRQALDRLDILVNIDPYPGLVSVLGDRTDGIYLLPAGGTMEYEGSATNSQRAVQWREKVIEPLFEARDDYEITWLFARKFGFDGELFKHIGVENGRPSGEDILREINRGAWTIGYTGMSPERLKLHMQHQDMFDTTTLRGSGPVEGEYYGLPWPCWGPPEIGHPGTPNLYNPDLHVAEGGLPFRARWGVEHEGRNLLAEGSYTRGSEITDGYPEFTYAVLLQLGWHRDLTPREQLIIAAVAAEQYEPAMHGLSDEEAGERLRRILDGHRPQEAVRAIEGVENGRDLPQTGQAAEAAEAYRQLTPYEDEEENGGSDEDAPVGEGDYGFGRENGGQGPEEGSFADRLLKVNWKTDLSGGIQRVAIQHGCAPFGNGKARLLVWNFPDPIPVHREPLYTTRRDLLPAYRTYDDRYDFRMPVLYWSIQQNDFSQEFPLILTSGRLVEYEGGGDETRSNIWLAEFQQQMFAEVNPEDAAAAGVANGDWIWLHTPEGSRVKVAALVTPRVGPGTVFMPFHFGGWFQGEDLSHRYPPGAAPYVVGEAANTAWTYGYDAITFMQESKVTLCRIEAAGGERVHVPGGLRES